MTQTKQITAKEIKTATAKMNYDVAILFLEVQENLELKVYDSLPFMKHYKVINHKEISGITVTKKIYDNDLANVSFTFNH